MLVILVAEPVRELGAPHVAVDRLAIRVTQNPLHAPILVVVTYQVLSKINKSKLTCNMEPIKQYILAPKLSDITVQESCNPSKATPKPGNLALHPNSLLNTRVFHSQPYSGNTVLKV